METITAADVGILDLGISGKETIVAEILRVRRRCRGPLTADDRKIITELLAVGNLDEAGKVDALARQKNCQAILKADTCGYDVNELILKGPLDGEEHEVTCPKCGVVISYRPPKAV